MINELIKYKVIVLIYNEPQEFEYVTTDKNMTIGDIGALYAYWYWHDGFKVVSIEKL